MTIRSEPARGVERRPAAARSSAAAEATAGSAAAEAAAAPRSFRAFTTIWAGQTLSQTGSALTSFALAVWVFERTGAVTPFALVSLCGSLPGLLLLPLAGVVADRWSRRRSMLVGDLGSAAVVAAIATLAGWKRLIIPHVCVAAALASILSSLRTSAYLAAVSMLVPARRFGRANGMLQLSLAAAQVLAPGLAAWLLSRVALTGVLCADLASFFVAAATVARVKVPAPASQAAASPGQSFWREVAVGWSYLQRRSDLLASLALLLLVNLLMGLNSALLTPMVLSFARPDGLATVSSAGGAGLLAGGLLMSATGEPKRRIRGITWCCLGFGAAFALTGVGSSVKLIATGVFAFLFFIPLVAGISHVIWQLEVPPHLQGRAFALRRTVSQSSVPLGQLVAGPLADHFSEPLSAHLPTITRLLGAGHGSGMRLLYVVAGLGFLCAVSLICRLPSLRGLDSRQLDGEREL